MLIQDNYKKISVSNDNRERENHERHRNRLITVIILIMLAAGISFVFCKVKAGGKWQEYGRRIYYRSIPILAERGKITDRNGVILAMNEPMRHIVLDPYKLPHSAEEKLQAGNNRQRLEQITQAQREIQNNITALALLLDKPRSEISRFFDYRYYAGKSKGDRYLKRQVDLATAEKIQNLQLPGIKMIPVYQRRYPDGNLFGQVIGITKLDITADQDERIVGLEGIEYEFDRYLRGINGLKILVRDNNGRYIDDVQSTENMPARAGGDLVLALDKNIQSVTMDVLRDTVAAHNADAGSAVVLDAKSGEVLAMVNYPDFDPARFGAYSPAVRRNYAVNDLIEPGSTFKPLIIARALDTGKIKPYSVIDTRPYKLNKHVISDVGSYPSLTVTGIIQKSSNVGVSHVAAMLNSRNLYDYLVSMGIGQKPRSGFPGEAAGVLHSWQQWSPLDKAALSYGYGTQMSLLQIARAYTVFTNDGKLLTPSFVKLTNPPPAVRIIAPATAAAMRQIMTTVTEPGGSGTRAAIAGFKVAGKSGTARKVINGRYADNQHVAMFAGFAPADKPRLIVVVSINNPRAGGYYGGVVAAPAFAGIMAASLGILGVTPAESR